MIFSSHHPEAGSIWLRCILMVSTPSCLQNTHAIAPFILSMVTALEDRHKAIAGCCGTLLLLAQATTTVEVQSDTRDPHLFDGVIGHNNHCVSVGDPHVPQVPILRQKFSVLPRSDVLQMISRDSHAMNHEGRDKHCQAWASLGVK